MGPDRTLGADSMMGTHCTAVSLAPLIHDQQYGVHLLCSRGFCGIVALPSMLVLTKHCQMGFNGG